MDYILHVSILFLVYLMLASSLDLVVGHVGLVSLVHAGFWGVGAYTSAILATRFGCSFVISLAGSILASSVLSLIVSFPSLRLKGDFFSIATFALQMIIWSLFNNLKPITGGALGLANIPAPRLGGWSIDGPWSFLGVAVMVTASCELVIYLVVSAPIGRALHVIREDEVLARSLGKHVTYLKVVACAVSAGIAGAAGCLYAHYVTFIDPTSFVTTESILIIAMVIFGGAGTFRGSLVGAGFLCIVPEALRFVGLASSEVAHCRQILYGLILIVTTMFRPQGLLGRYDLRKH